MKGQAFICEMTKDIKPVKVKEGDTLEKVLKAAEYDPTKVEHLRLNGGPAELTAKVSSEDIITMVPQVDGGN